ncbi:hypothetical protein DL768_008876 [Monosporascus sp. mg162]|nr:hypothetical protein DL768_008876 [Monosporascus sp. mg162]
MTWSKISKGLPVPVKHPVWMPNMPVQVPKSTEKDFYLDPINVPDWVHDEKVCPSVPQSLAELADPPQSPNQDNAEKAELRNYNGSGNANREIFRKETQQMQTFNLFSDLIPEIRFLIWEHYFFDHVLPPPCVHSLVEHKCWHPECSSRRPYKKEEHLMRHIETFHEVIRVLCPFCRREFNRRDIWFQHLYLHPVMDRSCRRTQCDAQALETYDTARREDSNPRNTAPEESSSPLFPRIPLINREAWAIAQICMRRYEHIKLKISFPDTSSAVRGGRFLANWDTDLLYVREESVLRLARAFRDAPWAPRIRRLAIRLPILSFDVGGGRSSEDPGLESPYFETLADFVRVLPGLRRLYLAPLFPRYDVIPPHVEDALVLDEFGFCGVNTYKEAYEAAKNENHKVVRLLRERINTLDAAGALWSRRLSWRLGRWGREVEVVAVVDGRENMRRLGWHET